MMLTYFTPSYNRAELLVKLYESLLKQTNLKISQGEHSNG